MILLWCPFFWVVDCPQYFGVCFSVFFICRHVVLRIISAVYREIWVTRFKFGIVWLSRELTSHNKGLFNIWDNIWDICIPTSVSVTDVHEHLAIIGFLCTQVNCDSIISGCWWRPDCSKNNCNHFYYVEYLYSID